MKGTVLRVVKAKGFGFIRGEDGVEYFFHYSALQNADFEALPENIEVTFENGKGPKGPRAEAVFVV